MAIGRLLDEGVVTRRDRRGDSDSHEERVATPRAERGSGGRVATLATDLVLAVARVVASTVGVAFGFSLLVFGLGRPVLVEVARLGEPGRADDEDVTGAGVLGAALKLMCRSWRDLVAATLRFALGVAIAVTPLSLLSLPVLLAVGIEPVARIASLDVEVAVDWGAASALAALGALLMAFVPAALRRVTELGSVSRQFAGSAGVDREVGR